MRNLKIISLFLIGILLLSTCGKDDDETSLPITLLTITVNSISLEDGTINVNVDPSTRFELTFSSAIDVAAFEGVFSLSSATGAVNDLSLSYTNATSKAVIEANLDFSSTYTLRVLSGRIGQNGEILNTAIRRTFSTRSGGVITEQAACISASADCLQAVSVTDAAGTVGNFDFYSSYPLDLANARWEKLKSAIIVVHGLNRNADDYFSYMMSSLRNENIEEEAVLIAPYFKNAAAASAGDVYWSNAGWREGQTAEGANNISSFAVIDQIIALLGDPTHFPVLETVLITGHSSGALFTQVYAAANRAESQYPDLDFQYAVANSQYFYYPDDVRYDANTAQFVAVTDCSDFNHWPLGAVNLPAYLSQTTEAEIDQRIIERKLTYVLGTADVSTTGTLNTSDCSAVVLGENRFERGENIVRLLETNYATTQNSEKVIVPGIGHNAQQMYQSAAFLAWLREVL